MNKYVQVLLLALFAVAIQHVANLAYIYLSFGNTIVRHYPGKCEQVKGITTHGAEDITLLPTGQAIITSGLTGFAEEFDYSTNTANGQLYVVNTTGDTSIAHKLTLLDWPVGEHFEPHGIDHWLHENNSISVFVVLHMPERVARFLYDGEGMLTLTKIYENSKFMKNLNSVFCTGEDSFYLSNLMHARFRDKFMAFIEFILYMPISNVVYVEGDNYQSAVDGLHLPNGLTGDNRYVYVATKGAVKVFSRRFDNTLKLYKVIRVKDPLGAAELESVFADDTSLIQAATVGIYSEGKLLIGSINDKLITCDVNYLSEP
ncbi:serum paraoxonase/arylesterase 2-like isoform X2 [Watersipora subatra]|uniref:serum paraoxonase/arylesterase 2-like isoform X2 n=1 Tax=Watersipora subatra TaxID=2589382 RepID=UPI00355C7655